MGSNRQRATGAARGTERGAGAPDVTIEVRAEEQGDLEDQEPAALRSEVERLREELHRRETELELVVERYERQLERRTREPEARTPELRVETPDTNNSGIFETLHRFLGRLARR